MSKVMMMLMVFALTSSLAAAEEGPSSPVAVGSAKDGSEFSLSAPIGVATYVVGDSTYAIVAAYSGDGVQIIDVSDPSSPVAMGSASDASDGSDDGDVSDGTASDGSVFERLRGAFGVSTFVVGGSTYAIVASTKSGGVQIIDVSNPSSPAAVSTASSGSEFPMLSGAKGVSTFVVGDSTYAIVASFYGGGVQIIDVSDPSSPVAAGSASDGSSFRVLNGAYDVATFVVGGSTYAIVTALLDNGVQIIDVSDPSSPLAVGSVTRDSGLRLGGPKGVSTFVRGGSTYAIVTSSTENGVQIIDVSDPSSPVAAGSASDGSVFEELGGAIGVSTYVVGDSTYAIVCGNSDHGVQIIDVSDPSSLVAAGSASDDYVDGSSVFEMLKGPQYVSTFVVGGSTYAIVTTYHWTPQDSGVQMIRLTDPVSVITNVSITFDLDYDTTNLTFLESTLRTQLSNADVADAASIPIAFRRGSIIADLTVDAAAAAIITASASTIQNAIVSVITPGPTGNPTPGPTGNPTPGPTSNLTPAPTKECDSKLFQRYSETGFKVASKNDAFMLITEIKKAFKAIKESYRSAKTNLRRLGREAKE